MAANKCPSSKLPSGASMPHVGLGTWKSKPGEVAAAVEHAIKVGYRHIDGAALYANETEVGAGLKAAFDKGYCTRSEVFVVSKLWCTDAKPEDVEAACRKTLTDLGLECLDLYLMHWPVAFKKVEGGNPFPTNEDGTKMLYEDVKTIDTWLAMEKLVEKGMVKDIGVSNFNSLQIQDILDNGKIKPATNQVECHPYLNQEKLNASCKEKGIVLTAYSPLGSPDRPWAKEGEPGLLDDPRIKEVAAKCNKTPAQVLLRFVLQRGIIVIPKSVTPSRIEENIDILDFELSDEDMELIKTFDVNKSFLAGVLTPDFPILVNF